MPFMGNPSNAAAAATEAKRKRSKMIWIVVGLAALYFFVLKK